MNEREENVFEGPRHEANKQQGGMKEVCAGTGCGIATAMIKLGRLSPLLLDSVSSASPVTHVGKALKTSSEDFATSSLILLLYPSTVWGSSIISGP